MENITDGSWSWSWGETDIADNANICESVTNHWLYFIFSGYLLPLRSPRVREFIKHAYSTLKNSENTGNIVSLTEFGFEKIQDIENNREMKDFIRRLCDKKYPTLSGILKDKDFEEFAWGFSGQKNKIHTGLQQTWKKLNKIIDQGIKKEGRP